MKQRGPVPAANGAALPVGTRSTVRVPPDLIRASLAELSAIHSAVDDHIIITVTDARGTIVKVNRAFTRISGYSEEELLGQNHRMLNSGVHGRHFWKQMWKTVASGTAWHAEVCNRAKDGSHYWVDTSIFPLEDAHGQIDGYVAVRVDITDRKRAEDELHRAALVDGLTGLPSRALLERRLTTLIRTAADRPGRIYAVLFIDLDNFKYVNDSLGHATGDRLLVETAKRLTAAIGSEDDRVLQPSDLSDRTHGALAARFGGDEFVVLLDDLSSVDQAVAVAGRIHEAMSIPVHVGSDDITVQCSIGIATGAGHECHAAGDDLLREADTAMYHAKACGKGRNAVFDGPMHTAAKRRLRLETDLRAALASNEIDVVYQPIVQLETGRVASFEALARWHHPELGVIAPDEFIPIAEETGLVVPLAQTQLYQAVELLERLSRQPGGERIRMNVNVSRRQLSDASFLSVLESLLATMSVHPSRLCLEITESMVTTSPRAIRESLSAIKTLGVQLHLDDFGTGLSSLSLLRTLPLDGIKIDRSFIDSAEGDREAIAILHAIITLGRNLRKVITAEGLETATHMATVLALQCDLAQGWLLGRPVDAATAETLLTEDYSSRFALNRAPAEAVATPRSALAASLPSR